MHGYPFRVGDRTSVADRVSRAPVDGILGAIGDTPLVALRRYLAPTDLALWVKLEGTNPGGSAKARPAARMLREALADGLIDPGGTVIESSSGNMGVGLAQACRFLGLNLICVVDVRTHSTNVRAMRALGASVRVVSRPDPVTGDLLTARLALVETLLREMPAAWWPDQYSNPANPAAHAVGTMREIDEALDGAVDALFVATSTTGTLLGCIDYLRAHDRPTRVVAVDAEGSTLFGGRPGARRLPGFGAGVPGRLSRGAVPDDIVRVSDLECTVGCRRLAKREAILAGASSGGVMWAVEAMAVEMPKGARCAAILPDGGEGYLDTVYDDAWVAAELGCDEGRLRELVGG